MALLTLKVQLLTKAALSPVLKYACINCANAGPTTICSVWKGIIIKQQNSYCGHKISVLNSLIEFNLIKKQNKQTHKQAKTTWLYGCDVHEHQPVSTRHEATKQKICTSSSWLPAWASFRALGSPGWLRVPSYTFPPSEEEMHIRI